jgi:two-component system, cell cycle sensor histidine kinase and response regulator CckA
MNKDTAILLADDDETVQEFGAMALSTLGREVLLAVDGSQCLELVRERGAEIGLIVLDMMMPDMNGDEVLASLRASGVSTPVLLCSGFEMTESEVVANGATAYLGKPYRMRELTEACRTLLER